MRRLQPATTTTTLLVLTNSLALGQFMPPTALIDGKSQQDLSAIWWQWAIDKHADQDPINDLDGSHGHVGDVGYAFFLAGAATTDPVVRAIQVPEGRPLFLPLINSFWDNTAPFGQPPTNFTLRELTDFITPFFDNATGLYCTVDGTPLAAPRDQRQTTGFDYVCTDADNLITRIGYDPTLGTGIYPATVSPAVTDGYWVALEPLPPGEHTITFGGLLPDWPFSQDITYHVIVVPEPGVALMSVILIWLALGSRRW